jgi:hypothetical protein
MIEKLNDRLSLYNSIYNDDDEDLWAWSLRRVMWNSY